MAPIITVVVPFYKVPKLRFRKCIESLREQTFKDFELLLICDGNAKEFEDFKKEFTSKDDRIRFIEKEHEGVSAARNLGMKEAKGQYLSFIDADDYVETNFLQKLYDAVQDADVSICGVIEQTFFVVNGWFDSRVFWSQPTFFNGLQYINFSVNKLYKLDIIRENNISFSTDVKLGEDALFLSQYFSHCKSIRCIPELLYHYIPNAKSAVHHFRKQYWDWEKQVIDAQWEMFHKYPLVERQEHAMICWLYVKFKGACYYYMYNMEDKQELSKKIEEIASHPLFKTLVNGDFSKKNRHLGRNDRIILTLWKMFGVKGIYLTKFLKDIRNR